MWLSPSCGVVSTFCSFLYGLKKRRVLFKKTGGVGGGLQRGFEGGLKGGLKGGFEGGFKGGLKGA